MVCNVRDNSDMRMRRTLCYAWAAPMTVRGLLLALLGALSGGGVQVVSGVLEAHGGALAWLLRHGTLQRSGLTTALGLSYRVAIPRSRSSRNCLRHRPPP